MQLFLSIRNVYKRSRVAIRRCLRLSSEDSRIDAEKARTEVSSVTSDPETERDDAAVAYSGRGYLNAILRQLPNAWRWALLLLPGEGNVRDLDEDQSERAEYPLEPDGTVTISTFVRYRMLMKTMVPTLDTPTGESACLAQPRFREVLLSVLTYDWPHPQEGHADLAEPLLRLMHKLRTFLAKNEHTDHWMYDILYHEKRHRGALIRAVFVRLRWHLDQRLPYNDLFKSSYFMLYDLLAKESLITPFQLSFRRTSGISFLVETLLAAIPEARSPQRLAQNGLRSTERLIIQLTLLLLDSLIRSREDNDELLEAVKAGFLAATIRLQHILPAPDAIEGEKWHTYADRWLNGVITPALIWPSLLSVFRKRPALLEPIFRPSSEEVWPSIRTTADRLRLLNSRYTLFKRRLKSRQGCSNLKCSESDATRASKRNRLSMCSCAAAFYCSSEGQEMHWSSGGHRLTCTNDANTAKLFHLRDGIQTPLSVRPSYLDYHFIKFCALLEVAAFIGKEKGTVVGEKRTVATENGPVAIESTVTDHTRYFVKFVDTESGAVEVSSCRAPAALEEGAVEVLAGVQWVYGVEVIIEAASSVSITAPQQLAEEQKMAMGQ
ncbi:hypothetical protein EV121DRAFT_291008 [Schizophyllum commune]